MIADSTETGTTLRENRLKIVAGTTILRSQACLIVGRRAMQQDATKLHAVQKILELIEARRRARGFAQVIANVPGASAAEVATRVMESPGLRGLQGPTVAPVYPSNAPDVVSGCDVPLWFAVSLIIRSDGILAAVDHLRSLGSTGIVMLPLQYAFGEESEAYRQLVAALV
jgi:ATP phosphoribosyltransferase